MSEQDRLKFIMQRMDHYYNGVNFKGTFFLGLNTFIIGGCLTSLHSIKNNDVVLNSSILLNFTVVSALCLISISLVLLAILPFLKTGNSYDYDSNIFFGAIALKSFKEFQNGLVNQPEAQFNEDLLRQVHVLSKGLKSKYIKVRNAGIVLFMASIASIPFFYQLITL